MKLVGAEKIYKSLGELDKKTRNQYLRKSLRKGANVTLKVARALAPKRTGLLARNIKVRAGKSNKYKVSILVGLGKKWFTGKAFYAAFVAFGHKIGSRKLGDNRKQVPANPFLERAFKQSREQAVNAVVESLKEQIKGGLK